MAPLARRSSGCSHGECEPIAITCCGATARGKVDGEAAAGQTLGGSRHGAQHSFDVAPTPVDEPFLD